MAALSAVALTSRYSGRNNVTTYCRTETLDLHLVYLPQQFLSAPEKYTYTANKPPRTPTQVAATAAVATHLDERFAFVRSLGLKSPMFDATLWHPCRITRLLTYSAPNPFLLLVTTFPEGEKTRSERLCVVFRERCGECEWVLGQRDPRGIAENTTPHTF